MSGLFRQSIRILLAVCIAANGLLKAYPSDALEQTNSTGLLCAACPQSPLLLDIQHLNRGKAFTAKGFSCGPISCDSSVVFQARFFKPAPSDSCGRYRTTSTLYALGCQLTI